MLPERYLDRNEPRLPRNGSITALGLRPQVVYLTSPSQPQKRTLTGMGRVIEAIKGLGILC